MFKVAMVTSPVARRSSKKNNTETSGYLSPYNETSAELWTDVTVGSCESFALT